MQRSDYEIMAPVWSPQATIETDEERTYFLIDIPCHPDFVVDWVY